MALAELTTLLATSGSRQADRRSAAESDQIQGLSVTDDSVAFDDELQAILVPFANGAIPAEASTTTIDSNATERLSDLASLDTIDQPEPDNSAAGSHFHLAFASALPVTAEPQPTLAAQPDIQTAAAATAQVVELSSSVEIVTLPAESNADSSNAVADDVVELPSSELETDDILDALDTPDGGGEQAAESAAVPESAADESASSASESQTQSKIRAQLQLNPHIELTSQEQFMPDSQLDLPDLPDAATVPQAIAGGPTSTSNSAAAMLMPAAVVPNFGSSVDVSLVDAPNLAEQIAAEAVKHAAVVKDQGQQRFTMRLDPPELGKLIVEMQRTEHGLTMRVNAADPVTLGLIQSSLEELNTSLGRQDSVFQEVNIDVSTGGEFQQSFADRSSEQALRKNKSSMPSDSPVTSLPDNQQNVNFVA